MAQQGSGKGFAVVLSMVAIAGVVGYLIYRRFKNKPKKDTQNDTGFTPAPTTTGGSFTPAPPSSGGGSSSSGNPFATKEDLIKFQQWVINTKGDKTILGKGGSTGYGDDGIWGSKSASAWAKYQKEYPKGGATSTTSGIDYSKDTPRTSGSVWARVDTEVYPDKCFPNCSTGTFGFGKETKTFGKYAYLGEIKGLDKRFASGQGYYRVYAPSDRRDMFNGSPSAFVKPENILWLNPSKYI